MSSITPYRAPVRPRVISPITGDAVLLEVEIADLLESDEQRSVLLRGPRSSGKTTALQHLAAVLPDNQLLLIDDDQEPPKDWAVHHRLLLHVREWRYSPDVVLNMALWTDDDVLEYLLSASPARTASVMGRWRKGTDHDLAEGLPGIVRWVLDQMIADDEVDSVRVALQEAFGQHVIDDNLKIRTGMFALASILEMTQRASELFWALKRDLPKDCQRLLNLDATKTVLAAVHVLETFAEREEVLHLPFPTSLIAECGQQFDTISDVELNLRRILNKVSNRGQAMAASILHAANRPIPIEVKTQRNLRFAVLPGIDWREADLQMSELSLACLAGATLTGANLNHTLLNSTDFSDANLSSASLRSANGERANLARANLTAADLSESKWLQASFLEATFHRATLQRTKLVRADLRGANLTEADLSNAVLAEANVEQADFRGANLSAAVLGHLSLRHALLDGANFYGADLLKCDLEGVQLESPNFQDARLRYALLTGSVMNAPNFEDADLRETGLADIQWPNANLRNASLLGASFHLGSTRSGLVGSPYPSHGTRTGFYTNDYDEQTYRTPEDIRKADLRGADLRGANIQGVDFYLVDLRGAKYDPEQLKHLIQCDAILHDRTTK